MYVPLSLPSLPSLPSHPQPQTDLLQSCRDLLWSRHHPPSRGPQTRVYTSPERQDGERGGVSKWKWSSPCGWWWSVGLFLHVRSSDRKICQLTMLLTVLRTPNTLALGVTACVCRSGSGGTSMSALVKKQGVVVFCQVSCQYTLVHCSCLLDGHS